MRHSYQPEALKCTSLLLVIICSRQASGQYLPQVIPKICIKFYQNMSDEIAYIVPRMSNT